MSITYTTLNENVKLSKSQPQQSMRANSFAVNAQDKAQAQHTHTQAELRFN